VVARHREEGEGPSSGLPWAEVGRELGWLRKIPGKMKRATKIVWAKNELGSHSRISNLIQGFEFKTGFEPDSNWYNSNNLFEDFSNLENWFKYLNLNQGF
jgi:hypothetical protein